MTAPKPSVLIFVNCYLPGVKFGGPISTVSNLVESLGHEFDIRIVTSDRDLGDPRPFPGIATNCWVPVGNAKVCYLSPDARSILRLARILRETPHDLLYLNSFFSPVFTIRPLIARRLGFAPRKPCVVAPRGELAPSALTLKSFKKRFFVCIARAFGLYNGLRWQASADHEASDMLRIIPEARGRVIVARNLPNISGLAAARPPSPSPDDALRVVFLARVAPIKNLEFALDTLAQCPEKVEFDIWGAKEDPAYWQACEKLMEQLPPHITVTYRGVAERSRVIEILCGYDLFFLPTKGENFGHAIAEALIAGTPVLISDRTPWQALESAGVGWELPLESGASSFAEAVSEAKRIRDREGPTWNRRVREYAVRQLRDPAVMAANRRLLNADGV